MDTNWNEWVDKCATLLKGNQIESRGYRYTRPAPMTYEHQWLWDSCFHAITYRWFDLDMAHDELLSVIAAQATDSADKGMIPHMTYWQGGGASLWGEDSRSIITQPPLIAVAAELVYQQSNDLSLLEKLYRPLCDYHEWFTRRRDPDGDHLVSLIHPWECGCDASPRWDAPMRLPADPTPDQTKASRHALVGELIRHDCDAQALAEAGHYHVEALDFNAIRAADLEALGRMAQILGKTGDAGRWHDEAVAIQHSIMQKVAGQQAYWDLSGPDEQPLKIETHSRFLLLFGGCASEAAAKELVADLENPRFWTNFPVTTTPTDVPEFAPDHYWRGNVWLSVNWLIYQGLRRYGYIQQASHIAQRSLELVEQSGFHEYFNPITGTGHGPSLQSWSTIVLDMLATEQGRS
jgi:glycogen debranching enzyme